MAGERVLGVDACKAGWIGIALSAGKVTAYAETHIEKLVAAARAGGHRHLDLSLRNTDGVAPTGTSPTEPWGPAAGRPKAGVIYTTDSNDRVLRRAAATLLAGGDELISTGFGRLSAQQLAVLMNDYRESAVGRPEEDLPPDVLERAQERPSRAAGWRSKARSGVFLVLAAVLLVGGYVAYRLDGSPILWVPLALAGAVCLVRYVWRD